MELKRKKQKETKKKKIARSSRRSQKVEGINSYSVHLETTLSMSVMGDIDLKFSESNYNGHAHN